MGTKEGGHTKDGNKEKSALICGYDGKDISYCMNHCPYIDCIIDNIEDDPQIRNYYDDECKPRNRYKESYRRADARWKRKQMGLPVEPIVYKRKDRINEYQREYRANMPDEQRERYRKWQREYAREKRRKERESANEMSVVSQ